jgi:hypothetical protein
MVISSLQPIADKDSSGAVKLTMHLRQIRIVQSQSVQLQRAAVPAAQPKLDQGKKTGLPVDAATSQKTVIHRLGLGLVDLGKKALNIP